MWHIGYNVAQGASQQRDYKQQVLNIQNKNRVWNQCEPLL